MQSLIKKAVCLSAVLLAVLVLTACDGEQSQPVAPMGDHAVLEQLADAYRKVSEQYPVQPQAMSPEGRKKFLTQVFKQAGYNYSASLIAAVQTATDNASKDQRDLVELLLLPTKGLSDEALGKMYSADELAAVQQLRKAFR